MILELKWFPFGSRPWLSGLNGFLNLFEIMFQPEKRTGCLKLLPDGSFCQIYLPTSNNLYITFNITTDCKRNRQSCKVISQYKNPWKHLYISIPNQGSSFPIYSTVPFVACTSCMLGLLVYNFQYKGRKAAITDCFCCMKSVNCYLEYLLAYN